SLLLVMTIALISASTGVANAGAPAASFGLKEGDLIRGVGDIDVFVVNQATADKSFARLFLSPVQLNLYPALRGFKAVKQVNTAVRDAYMPPSGFFRVVNTEKVYCMEATGEDVG